MMVNYGGNSMQIAARVGDKQSSLRYSRNKHFEYAFRDAPLGLRQALNGNAPSPSHVLDFRRQPSLSLCRVINHPFYPFARKTTNNRIK